MKIKKVGEYNFTHCLTIISILIDSQGQRVIWLVSLINYLVLGSPIYDYETYCNGYPRFYGISFSGVSGSGKMILLK